MDHIKAWMETSKMEVEPTDGGGRNPSLALLVVPMLSQTPQTPSVQIPNLPWESQETGSITEARSLVMCCYSSRDHLIGLTLTLDFVVVKPSA